MAPHTWLALTLATFLAVAAGSLLAAEVADQELPLPPSQLQLTGWLGQRVEANWKNRLLAVNLDERLRPFKSPSEGGGWSGEHIGKWLHASCLAWQYSHDAKLRARILEATATLISCQAADGYLGTYAKDKRWSGWDVWTHKYNLIGLLSVYETFQTPEALAAARKIGDLLAATFGDAPGQRDIIRAGEHVGMAATSVLEPIVLLYRDTHEQRYLDFARYIVRSYDQPHGPKIVASLTAHGSVHKTANGKAYEMMSNLVGLCELYRVTGDAACLKACRNAYADIVANRMYLTGGTSLGEHFQADHSLPNVGAVSENCAQVTWLQLCLELLRLTGEAKYADTLEQIVYNHLLAAQLPSGESLCYFTPLAGKKPYDRGCNCCTSSGPRGIALLTTFAYATAPGAVIVNLYEPSTAKVAVSGAAVKVTQQTRYPLDGKVLLTVDPQQAAQFELRLRIPAWCKSYRAALGGKPLEAAAPAGEYLRVSRLWQKGDTLEIEFAMPAVLVRGTHTNKGLVAVRRGPLVLAFDARLTPELSIANVSPAAEADGTWKLAPVAAPAGTVAHAFAGEGLILTAGDGKAVPQKVPLLVTSFAEAGSGGGQFAVWFPAPAK